MDMAGLIKNPNGVYAIQFKDPVKGRKRISLRTKNKRTAERLKAKLESEFLLGEFDPWAPPVQEQAPLPNLTRLGEAVDAYMAACNHLSPHTLRTYRSIFHLFRDFLGSEFSCSEITAERVMAFLDHKVKERGPVTRRKYLNHLGYLFRFLVERGVMERDLSKEVKLPRLPPMAPKYMTEEDVETLCQAILRYMETRRNHADAIDWHWLIHIIRCNVHLGLRLGELVHLRWEHVDLDKRILRVANTAEFTTKRGKERSVPIPSSTVDLLRELKAKSTSEYVFTSPRGRLRLHYLSQMFLRFRREAGLKSGINFHSLRHTYATWLAQKGTPVQVIKEVMGHSSITTTERYMWCAPSTTDFWVRRAFDTSGPGSE